MTISPREHQVAQLLTSGYSNKDIAAHLNISSDTVKFHVLNLTRKFNTKSRVVVAVEYARQHQETQLRQLLTALEVWAKELDATSRVAGSPGPFIAKELRNRVHAVIP